MTVDVRCSTNFAIYTVTFDPNSGPLQLVYKQGYGPRISLLALTWLPANSTSFTPDGATARGGPWPPLQYASRSLGSLLYLSIRLNPSFSGPWTRHPAISFLVFLFVVLHTAFRTASFFAIAVSCILSLCPSQRILWHLTLILLTWRIGWAHNNARK